MESKRALVTGGAGFIGSHLCRELLNREYDVICLDDFSTGSPSNIKPHMKHPNFSVLQHDIREPINFSQIPKLDVIFHLACPASPVHYQRDPLKTLQTCIQGTTNCLELARYFSAEMVHASTSEVYGDPLQHPQRECYWGNVNPVGPRSCYDEGKRCAETLCYEYRKHLEVDCKVVRIFNTYGPNMRPDDGRVISNFVSQALTGQDITIYGDGLQTRSFCFIEDLINGLLLVAGMDKFFFGPVNLGNPVEYTILETAKKIINLTGSSSKIIFLPLPANDPKRRKPDIAVAAGLLGWGPKISLHEGLLKSISYFRQWIFPKIL